MIQSILVALAAVELVAMQLVPKDEVPRVGFSAVGALLMALCIQLIMREGK